MMLKAVVLRLVVIVGLLPGFAHLLAAQEEPSSGFQITVEDVVLPETCDEHGWRIAYEPEVEPGNYYVQTLWRYFVQTVNGDVNLVHFWGSGYSAYVQHYRLPYNSWPQSMMSGYYVAPLSSDTYEAESIEYVLDGDAVIWELRATVSCKAGVVVAADIFSEPRNTTRETLPIPGRNLVLALNDIPIYANAGGRTNPIGKIGACQTFFLSDIYTPRASITTYGTESLSGHEIVLAGGLAPVPLVDVDENYGQPGGQPELTECAQDATAESSA